MIAWKRKHQQAQDASAALRKPSFIVKLLFTICSTLVLLSVLSFYEDYGEEKVSLSQLRRKIAVVYAFPTFHEEVTSAVSCMLHDLGYYVVVYIGNGWHIQGMMIPFSGRRKQSSNDFYGRCVSQWETINDNMKFVSDPDLLVFVTFPMLQRVNSRLLEPEKYAVRMLKSVSGSSSSSLPGYYSSLQYTGSDPSTGVGNYPKTSVVYITHHSPDLLHNSIVHNEKFFPRRRSTYVFLGEHTMLTAKRILEGAIGDINRAANGSDYADSVLNKLIAERRNDLGPKLAASFNLDYVFPVVPIEYITRHRKTELGPGGHVQRVNESSVVGSVVGRIMGALFRGSTTTARRGGLFAMQGNFGGKHAHRKDPKGIVTCMQKLEMQGLVVGGDYVGITTRIQPKSKMPPTPAVSSSSSVKNYNEKKPVGKNTQVGNATRNVTAGMTASNRVSNERRLVGFAGDKKAPDAAVSFSLDLIGHMDGDLQLGLLKTGKIRILSGLKSREYYEAICQAKFMLVGVADSSYFSMTATSSVPAGLMCGLPLVTTKKFLSLYPCLRDAFVHANIISQNTECESIAAAAQLSDELYERARSEVMNCSAWMYEQAKVKFSAIAKGGRA